MDTENDLPLEGDSDSARPVETPADVHSAVAEAVRSHKEKTEAPPAPRTEREAAPANEAAERARDASGRFAPRTAPETPAAPEGAPTAPEASQARFQPPPGWSSQARAEFGKLPPHVQEAVARREDEVNRGFAVLQNYKGLETFNDRVRQANTTHAQVMDRAFKWEEAVVRDPIGSALHLLSLRGITPQMLQTALSNPQALNQLRQSTTRAAPQPQQPQMSQTDIQRMVAETVQRTQAEREIGNQISTFFSDPKYPHAAALEDDMALLIENNRAADLQSAYQMAIRLHPELSTGPSAVQSNANAASAQRAAKATVGAPSGGRTPTAASGTPKTVADAVRMAVARQRG